MLQKPGDDEIWLFPECFDYLLRNQLEDGSWSSSASVLDGILNTAAALLAVRKHLSHNLETPSIQEISCKAEAALTEQIRRWDVSSCDQVGYELLVTTHLNLLEKEEVILNFPQREQLVALRDMKLSRLPPSWVHKGSSTLHHSLEGLIGHIDFDDIAQWREPNGSMMGSPSSTAAYLMHASRWDDLAEAYLRDALLNGSGHGDGGVPSAWPSSILELFWAITTLAESGISIGEPEVSTIADYLETSLQMQKGIVGFAPRSLADADDTAKSAMALHYLGRKPEPYIEALISTFEIADHFQTYLAERNPSLSMNINIAKAASSICAKILVGDVKEKWHRHQLYWIMLLSKAVVLLYKQMQKNETLCERLLGTAPNLKEQIPIISLQMAMTVLKLQNSHGNWVEGCELTAYAVLTLSSLAQLGLMGAALRARVCESVNQGKAFLAARKPHWKDGAYLWTEKVTYSSGILSEAYCLAAAVSFMTESASIAMPIPFRVSEKAMGDMNKAGRLISRTPLFNEVDVQLLGAAQLQACYALSDLQRRRLDIFPRTGMEEDKYLTLIPLTWTALDEYMEDVLEIQAHHEEGFTSARATVRQLFIEASASHDGQNGSPGISKSKVPGGSGEGNVKVNAEGTDEAPEFSRIRTVLSRYIAHILHHPSVVNSTRHMQTRLARELEFEL
ncbi:hypothetical protein GGR54DRAFT_639917 [Hypoxylon sp. NC1633]|nr:hypothetical protein GGR54DRAFT_639917 [Hypoxylon sp. NC1633]